MDIITPEKANELYWLGRYVERVHTTIREFFRGFDRMIDEKVDSHTEFCYRMTIPDVYPTKEDFLRNYPFDEENPDSILSNLLRAYDNAIVLRDEIGTETLSYVQLAVYEMRKASISVAPLIQMQNVTDYLFAFWGCLDDTVSNEAKRSIVKAGRRVERLDLHLRFGTPSETLKVDVLRLRSRLGKAGIEVDPAKLDELEAMVSADRVPYRDAIRLLEGTIEI